MIDDLAIRSGRPDNRGAMTQPFGSVGFDGNGDPLGQYVTFYRVDPSAADGAGDWVI